MSSTHIIVVTGKEEPRVFLSQSEYAELISSLRLDGQFAHMRSNIYALVPDPDPDHHPSSLKAVRLMKVGSSELRHPADLFFQEALGYLEKVNPAFQGEFIRQWKVILSHVEASLPPNEVREQSKSVEMSTSKEMKEDVSE